MPISSDSPHVIAPAPVIFLASFLVGIVIEWFWPLQVFASKPFMILGWVVAALAGVLAAQAAWTIREYL